MPCRTLHPVRRTTPRFAGLGWTIAWLLLLSIGTLRLPGSPAPSRATRRLPTSFDDLVAFIVRIEVTPAPEVLIQAFEETVPGDWAVSGINFGGRHDPSTRRIRWGPFPDALPRSLAYTLLAPLDAPHRSSLAGLALFGTESFVVEGDSSLIKRAGLLQRLLPIDYLPGDLVTVRLRVLPGASALTWTLQETLPVGWNFMEASDGGTLDVANHALKWGPFLDPAARDILYQIQSPLTARSDANFAGLAHLEGIEVPIAGANLLPIHPHHLVRRLPPPFVPQKSYQFQIESQPAAFVKSYGVEEDVPTGFHVSDITFGGTHDAATGRIKWGPFNDAHPRALEFTLAVPAEPPAEVQLRGHAFFDDQGLTTDGPGRWVRERTRSTSELISYLPFVYQAGVPILAELETLPADEILLQAVELSLPPGWEVTEIDSGGVLDAGLAKLKWGPFNDHEIHHLRFRLTPALTNSAGEPARFASVGWFDTTRVQAQGVTTVLPAPDVLQRSLPARFNAGENLAVVLTSTPAPGTRLQSLEESIPAGWTVERISDLGVFDPVASKIKWGPFADGLARALSYRVTSPADARQDVRFFGQARFEGRSLATSGDADLLLNHGPDPQPDRLRRSAGRAAKLAMSDLLTNDSDVDGDALRIVGLPSRTTAGGRLRQEGPWIHYAPPLTAVPADQFSYTVRDPFGAESVASVTLDFAEESSASRMNILEVVPQPAGQALVRFAGLPGFTYRLEVSRDLRHWEALALVTVNARGLGEARDFDVAAFPLRFYRIATP